MISGDLYGSSQKVGRVSVEGGDYIGVRQNTNIVTIIITTTTIITIIITTTTITTITIIIMVISPDMPGSIVASLDKFSCCGQYPPDIHVHILTISYQMLLITITITMLKFNNSILPIFTYTF